MMRRTRTSTVEQYIRRDSHRRFNRQQIRRGGFTLIELLIVITIVLILMSLTVATFSYVRESDRVSAEASKMQSFISGARDRAIYNDEMRGVRLFVEPPPPGTSAIASSFSRTVTSMAYIAPGGTWNAPEHSANIDIMRIDGNVLNAPGGTPPADGDFEDPEDLLIKIRGSNNPGWWNLKRRGWLVDGLRMRIPAGPTGHWYTINTGLIDVTAAPTADQFLILDVPFADGGNQGEEVAWESLTYEIELPPRILPVEPALLADGVVIDLDGSDIPNIWRPDTTAAGNGLYSGYMDIWFSPRGNLIGEAAAAGVLHFYVCDAEDSSFLKEQWVDANGFVPFNNAIVAGNAFVPLDEIDPLAVGWLTWDGNYLVKDRRLVTLFAQTGGVTVNRVNAYVGITGGSNPDTNNDGIADDPYRFAETGEVAK